MEAPNPPRRQPRWPVLIPAVLLTPAIGGILTGLVLTAIVVIDRALAPSPEGAMFDIPATVFLVIGFGAVFGVLAGAPLVALLAVLGHVFTDRRPVDGLVLGALGATGAALLIGYFLEYRPVWHLAVTLPIGALLGHEICRLGYRRGAP